MPHCPWGEFCPPWCGHGFHGGAKSQSDGRAAADPSALVLPLPPGRQCPCSRRHSPSSPLAPLGLGPPRTGSSLSSHPLPAASSFKSGLSVARLGDDRTPCGPPRRSRRAGCGRPGAGGHWDHVRALGHHQPGPRTPPHCPFPRDRPRCLPRRRHVMVPVTVFARWGPTPPCLSAHTGRPASSSNNSLAIASDERTNRQQLPAGLAEVPVWTTFQGPPPPAGRAASYHRADCALDSVLLLKQRGHQQRKLGTRGQHFVNNSKHFITPTPKNSPGMEQHHWEPGEGPAFLERGGRTGAVNTATPAARAESPGRRRNNPFAALSTTATVLQRSTGHQKPHAHCNHLLPPGGQVTGETGAP